MKKYLIALVLCVLTLTASAQVFTAEQIEKYAKDKYGDNWTEAAGNLSKEVALDNKNRLHYHNKYNNHNKSYYCYYNYYNNRNNMHRRTNKQIQV